MKKTLACVIVLMLCAVGYSDEIWYNLSASTSTPASGATVTFKLTYDGTQLTAHPGWGILFDYYNGALSGTGGWSTPLNPTILLSGLATGTPTSPTDPASPGTPFANGVTGTKLSVDMSATSFPQMYGSTGPVDIWSVQVPVTGTPGQTVTLTLTKVFDSALGVSEGWGAGASADFSTNTVQEASKTVTITALPEPMTLGLVGLGLGGVALIRRRLAR